MGKNNWFNREINETIDKMFQFGFDQLESEESKLLEDTFLQTYLYNFEFLNDVFIERMNEDKVNEFVKLYNSGESLGDMIKTFYVWFNANWRLIDWAYTAFMKAIPQSSYKDNYYSFSLCCPPNNGVYRMKLSVESGRKVINEDEVKEEG